MRIRQKAPFFSALLMYAGISPSARVATAATDGQTIWYNPDFFGSLAPGGIEAVLVHEVMHCALGHAWRRSYRDARVWNYAADIVVNGIIAAEGSYALPVGAVRDPKLEMHSTEEVYRILSDKGAPVPEAFRLDILDPAVTGGDGTDEGGDLSGEGLVQASEATAPDQKSLTLGQFWAQAIQNASLASAFYSGGQGSAPAGLDRLFSELKIATIDWRAELWRFLVHTPTDYSGYDRRFIHRGLYLDDVDEESVRVNVVIDTSGSISGECLSQFMGELKAILGSYPHIDCELYYADAELYGPYAVDRSDPLPAARGGGGTSFVPFFEQLRISGERAGDPSVYLTDGYGTFPQQSPSGPVLWVVTPGGLQSSSFPFGDVLRLVQ
jgi:predicted metal-dependent peptidase